MAEEFPELRKQFAALQEEKAALAAKVAPLREKRDALARQLEPMDAELRALGKKIAAIERPRMTEIDNQIGALAKVMGGRVIQHGE